MKRFNTLIIFSLMIFLYFFSACQSYESWRREDIPIDADEVEVDREWDERYKSDEVTENYKKSKDKNIEGKMDRYYLDVMQGAISGLEIGLDKTPMNDFVLVFAFPKNIDIKSKETIQIQVLHNGPDVTRQADDLNFRITRIKKTPLCTSYFLNMKYAKRIRDILTAYKGNFARVDIVIEFPLTSHGQDLWLTNLDSLQKYFLENLPR